MSEDPAVRKHQDILKLISLYKENTCLWDPSETGANMHDRRIVYDEIACEMGCSADDVKNKLRNLRAQFRREIARQKRLHTKRAKWIYYNALEFLRPSIEYANGLHDSRSKLGKQQSLESDIDQEWESQPSPLDENTTMPNFHEESQFQPYEDYQQRNTNEADLESQSTSENSKLANKQKSKGKRVIVISRERPEERDEFTAFGEHVASELRLLEKHKDLQKALKCSILQSILDVNRANVNNSAEDEEQEVYSEETYLEDYAG